MVLEELVSAGESDLDQTKDNIFTHVCTLVRQLLAQGTCYTPQCLLHLFWELSVCML